MKHIIYLSYISILVWIVWIMPVTSRSTISFNLLPFETIRLYIHALLYGFAPLSIILANLIGNIVITIPIGFMLIRYIRDLTKWEAIFFSFYIPAYIEIVQLLLHLIGYGTRSIDVDDILLNMLGIWIGLFIARTIQHRH